MRPAITVGVVGVGAWGEHLARTFDESPRAELRWLCDHSLEAQIRTKIRYPRARLTTRIDDLLNDEGLDAVVLATPGATHFELARRVLEAEKHVLVERPLAFEGEQAEALVRLAERVNRRLMVGEVLVFHPAVRKLRELIEVGRLGELYYIHGTRHARPPRRDDESRLWSLGADDLSVVLYLLGDEPVEVAARGESFLHRELVDVVFCYLRFATGIAAHLHLSCVDVQVARRLTVVGSKRMAVFDDAQLLRRLTVHQRAHRGRRTHLYEESELASLGEIVTPRLANEEPLRLQCEHFLTGIHAAAESLSARQGAALVNVLEALERSLAEGGAPMSVAARAKPEPLAPKAPVVPLTGNRTTQR